MSVGDCCRMRLFLSVHPSMNVECHLLSPSGHLDLEGLFLVNGNAERVDWLRQRYESGEEVELEKEADLASAVSLLRLFLQELPEPVIPTAIQGHILQLHQGVS